MKIVVFAFSLFTLVIGFSQNLIMNPSFEDYWQCPDFISQIDRCKYVYSPDKGSPDYFNNCSSNPIISVPNNQFGYQTPKSGNAYVGLFHSLQSQYVKEYIQLSFSEVLSPLKTYHFSIFANISGNTGWTSDFFHFKFTDTLIHYNNTYLCYIMSPDIMVNNLDLTNPNEWVEVGFDYVAQGGEKYIIIGNFNENLGTDAFSAFPPEGNGGGYAYFYFDDASLIEIQQPSVPTITTTPATCTENGSASISNFDTLNTYTFSPPGPTVDSNGDISGMLPGTSYTVTTNDGTNDSDPSDAFTIEAQLPAVPAPTVTSPQSFCGATLTSDLVPSTSEYNWYTTIGGETLLNPNDTLYSGTYYVSHQNGNCESEKAVVEVIIHPIPTLTVSPNASICEGETVLLTVMGADNYVWSSANENGNTLSVSPTSTTTYTVTGTTNEGCSDTVSVTVTVVKPVASFSVSTDLGSIPFDVHFTNTSSSATSYNWSVDSVYQSSNNQFTYHFETEGSYVITLIASNGACSDTINKTIKAIYIPASPVDIPNVFSPNADNVNDLWTVNAQLKNIIILNRWGNVVYSAGAEFNGWDGTSTNATPVKDGVYFYKIEDLNGKIHTGFITLFR